MDFQLVFLWSDIIIWILFLAVAGICLYSWRNPNLKASWLRVGNSRKGMAAASIMLVFIAVGLLDSIHYRPKLEAHDKDAPVSYSIEVLSLLDYLAESLREKNEKTYSEPLGVFSFSKENIESLADDGKIQVTRDFPRLRYGGAHLKEDLSNYRSDILGKTGRALMAALSMIAVLWFLVVLFVSRKEAKTLCTSFSEIVSGNTPFAWNAVLISLSIIFLISLPILYLCVDYHVFGTDKVGQDVLYQVLKSIRTALVVGLVTTLVAIPIGIALGLAAGYFKGWIDDVIQYVYTVLNSIPDVLLMAAAVLMLQVVIDIHPHWFSTAAERADARLLALCLILGMTSWTGLCRLLRGEALKLRELEYVQAAQSFGVSDARILLRHLMPNVMHLIIITLVMDFSKLVLFEAVLSYIGIGVDPSMISFGNMINNARMEMARDPMVWWSLVSAFFFMVTLVLSANLFADTVRDAFDPRMARKL